MLRIDECNRTKLTMHQLAHKVGYTREYLQAIKSGKKGQTLENVQKISQALECSPVELLPLEWQTPAVDSPDLQNNIARIITLYESLKPTHPSLTAEVVAIIILAISKIPSIGILSDEEIRRYFYVRTLG